MQSFDRTTGTLSLYTDDYSLAGMEIEYAIRCESVFADSKVQDAHWIQVAGDDPFESPSPMNRLGDDDELVDSSLDSSCSSSYQAPNYSDKLLRRHSKHRIEGFSWNSGSSSSSSNKSGSSIDCCPTEC